MNRTKSILFCIVVTMLTATLLSFGFATEETYDQPTSIYQVYLDGEKIGLINSKDDLYALINKEQVEIKDEYNVDQVYPPKGFKIVRKTTYDENISDVKDVYEKIKDQKEFTIKGYTITIKSSITGVEPTYVYVIDQKIFEKSINDIVTTFVGEERYKQYKKDEQPQISETGYLIEDMYFDENITIKESYISVDEKIYTDSTELTKHLLFGNNVNYKEYKVVQGDTLESIANANQINTKALMMVNTGLTAEDTLLAIGQKLNVAGINPILSLVTDQIVVEDVEEMYGTTYEEDPTMYVGKTKVKSKGVKGINRVTSSVQLINGQRSEQAFNLSTVVVKAPQNEVILKGTKKYAQQIGPQIPVTITGSWGWPTNSGYVITSPYGWRLLNGVWDRHNGIDISGTGRNSPIYAVQDGVVYQAGYAGVNGWRAGYNITIQHPNGYYTVYAHLTKGSIRVKAGDVVKRGDVIGGMGASGQAYGVHLHFGVYYGGLPFNGGTDFDPMKLYR